MPTDLPTDQPRGMADPRHVQIVWNGGSALLRTISVNRPLDCWPKQEQRQDALLIQRERSRPTARDNRAMCEIETEREIEGRIISARWPLWLLIVGTLVGSLVGSAVAQPTEASDVSSQLRGIASAGQLPELRWPNFSDYRQHMQNFYQPSDYTPAWVRNGQPTPQALAIINLLKQADSQGLDPEDYDGSRWADRLARMQNPHAAGPAAIFDAALTVCLMRYISDCHIGKINPEHFKFGLNVEEKKYDLPAFLRERLVNGQDVKTELAQIGPP